MKDAKSPAAAADLKSRVMPLAGLIQVQAGSVVSREILSGKAGSVTVFAFDKDERLSEHAAPFDALVCGLEGEGIVTVGGVPHPVKTGEMIIMPADIPHALKATTAFKMMLVMIRK